MKVQTEYVVAQFNISKKEIISNERLNARLDSFASDFNNMYKDLYSMDALLSVNFYKSNKILLLTIENEYPSSQIFRVFDDLICSEKYSDLRSRLCDNHDHKCNC